MGLEAKGNGGSEGREETPEGHQARQTLQVLREGDLSSRLRIHLPSGGSAVLYYLEVLALRGRDLSSRHHLDVQSLRHEDIGDAGVS